MPNSAHKTTALSLNRTPAPAEQLRADEFPARGGSPRVHGSSPELPRHIDPGMTPLHAGTEVHWIEQAGMTTSIELLPIDGAPHTEPAAPFRQGRSGNEPHLASRRPATASLHAVAGPERHGTNEQAIVFRSAPRHVEHTSNGTWSASGSSEPFGGTKGLVDASIDSCSMTDPARCAGRKVAVGGLVASRFGIGSGLRDADTWRGSSLVDNLIGCTDTQCTGDRHSGADLHHAPLPRRSAAGQGFVTRVGAVHAGWCDVSSRDRRGPSDPSCDSIGVHGGKSFLAVRIDRTVMHQEDGITVGPTRLPSFRGTSPASSDRQGVTWTSRSESTINDPAFSELSFIGCPGRAGGSRTPDSVMLTAKVGTDQGGPDEWMLVGGAGFFDLFPGGRRC